jgi:acetyl esterase/lipase
MASSQQLDSATQMFRSMGERVQALAPVVGMVEGFRIAIDEMVSQFPLDENIKLERVGAGGVPAEWVAAPDAADDQVLLYLHGGGYMGGSMRSHRVMLSRLSRASGMRVLGLEYRLAPENPFPAAVEDSIAAYRWLLSQGVESKNIAIAGDSAGGGLTPATLIALRYVGEPMPAAGVCISPWVDLEGIGGSMTTNAEVDLIVQRELLDVLANLYLGNRDRRTPLAAPLYADLQGLPPLLIQVGSSETLLDDSNRLTERAKAAGVDATLEVWEDMIHTWHLFAPILPEGQQAIERIGEFLRQRVGSVPNLPMQWNS